MAENPSAAGGAEDFAPGAAVREVLTSHPVGQRIKGLLTSARDTLGELGLGDKVDSLGNKIKDGSLLETVTDKVKTAIGAITGKKAAEATVSPVDNSERIVVDAPQIPAAGASDDGKAALGDAAAQLSEDAKEKAGNVITKLKGDAGVAAAAGGVAALDGVRRIAGGLKRDQETGKRKLGKAFVGAVETALGAVTTVVALQAKKDGIGFADRIRNGRAGQSQGGQSR